jgi:hypothetical protein
LTFEFKTLLSKWALEKDEYMGLHYFYRNNMMLS